MKKFILFSLMLLPTTPSWSAEGGRFVCEVLSADQTYASDRVFRTQLETPALGSRIFLDYKLSNEGYFEIELYDVNDEKIYEFYEYSENAHLSNYILPNNDGFGSAKSFDLGWVTGTQLLEASDRKIRLSETSTIRTSNLVVNNRFNDATWEMIFTGLDIHGGQTTIWATCSHTRPRLHSVIETAKKRQTDNRLN